MSTKNSTYSLALATLKDSAADEERVEVNQRALIDKILVRMAGCFVPMLLLLVVSCNTLMSFAFVYHLCTSMNLYANLRPAMRQPMQCIVN